VLTYPQALAGFGLNSYTFLPALTLAYAYTFAQDNPTRQVNFFVLNFDAKYLPFALLFMSFIMDGPEPAMAQVTGLIAAHMYDFLTRIWPTFGGGKNYITTPQFVKRLFMARAGTTENRGFGHTVQGRGRATGSGAGADPASARSTGSLWGQAGPGRRLGE
jgi:Derlin-2/3